MKSDQSLAENHTRPKPSTKQEHQEQPAVHVQAQEMVAPEQSSIEEQRVLPESDVTREKHLEAGKSSKQKSLLPHPLWVLVQKEVSDHIRSWRYIILLILIGLTCLGSLYTGMSTIRDAIINEEVEGAFVFLKLFTASDGTLPPFITFIGFLGPLLGIALGFDAINAERNKGTLIRILAQPVPRDYILNIKLVSGLIVTGALLFALGFLVMGSGILLIGIPPTPAEFLRILCFLLLSVIYVGFWLNLSILCSVFFRQAATSALACIAVWLFFSVFYNMIVNLLATARFDSQDATAGMNTLEHIQFVQLLERFSPSQLFSDATTTLLLPNVRSLGPLTLEQLYLAIPSPLPLGQSLLLVWPQLTGLLAVTMLCFALSYVRFMRQDIRARQ